jgi:hypothetical protein
MKINFDQMIIGLNKIPVTIFLSEDACLRLYYFDIYNAFISACGWSQEDFNKELIRRVDIFFSSL